MKTLFWYLLPVYAVHGFWWSATTETQTTVPPDYTVDEDHYFQDKILQLNFVVPGTKYCGPGSRSTGPDDLGIFWNVDKCCRDHDFCPDNIPAGEYKHGLHNTAKYTKSHCGCDETFHQCLKNVSSVPARIVGAFYFTIFHITCFRKEFPIIECTRERHRRCLQYKLNTTAIPVYQWFDNPFFRHWMEHFPDEQSINDTINELVSMTSSSSNNTTIGVTETNVYTTPISTIEQTSSVSMGTIFTTSSSAATADNTDAITTSATTTVVPANTEENVVLLINNMNYTIFQVSTESIFDLMVINKPTINNIIVKLPTD